MSGEQEGASGRSPTEERWQKLYEQVKARLDPEGRTLLARLSDVVGELLLEHEEYVLDRLVIGVNDPGCSVEGMSWRETRRSDFDPVVEVDADRASMRHALRGTPELTGLEERIDARVRQFLRAEGAERLLADSDAS